MAGLVSSAGADASPSSKLALELSLAGLDPRVEWARQALAELRTRLNTDGRDGVQDGDGQDGQDFELVFA